MSTIFSCFNPNTPVAESTISAMRAASDYWQPDATSFASSADGHCRMARATLFNTSQSKLEAVHSEDTGNLISANARLDNRPELAEALGIDAHMLAAVSDGALILAAYRQWGEECPQRLLGDFVFIIWDESKQRLFCARDHFGVKVLFYSRGKNGCMVSNEHNAFFTSRWQPKEIEEPWLIRQLWGLGSAPFQSPYRNIESLPAAHSMVIDENGVFLSRYWTLEDKSDWQDMADDALIEELRNRFQQAVKVRLDSAYPLGAELSEGLDSNGIAGFAAQMLGEQPLHTFSYGCEKLTDENRSIWEKTYQDIFDMLAMHANLQPVWTEPEKEGCLNAMQADFDHHSGGVANTAGGRFDYASMASKQGIRVLLSGWGGDHCVSSYGNYYEDDLLRQGRWLALHRLLRGKHRRGRSGHPFKAWAHLVCKHLAPPLYRRRLRRRGGLERAMWQRAEHHPLKQRYIRRYDCKKSLKQFTDAYQCYSARAYHHRELFEVGVENRLVGSELVARMFRIEYRFPMLDVPLVELAYNMPSHLKIADGMERYMFRRVLEGVTTERIQWRNKADVNHPRFDQNRARISNLPLEQLRDSKLARRYMNMEKLTTMADEEVGVYHLTRWAHLLLTVEKQLQSGEENIIGSEQNSR